MKTKEFIILMLYNIIALAVCAVLAIVFNHWWIVLFSILFMAFPKINHYRICDGCGKCSESAETREESLQLAKKAGWVHYENGTDYCPECKYKIKHWERLDKHG